jgi:hypothetical protein
MEAVRRSETAWCRPSFAESSVASLGQLHHAVSVEDKTSAPLWSALVCCHQFKVLDQVVARGQVGFRFCVLFPNCTCAQGDAAVRPIVLVTSRTISLCEFPRPDVAVNIWQENAQFLDRMFQFRSSLLFPVSVKRDLSLGDGLLL